MRSSTLFMLDLMSLTHLTGGPGELLRVGI